MPPKGIRRAAFEGPPVRGGAGFTGDEREPARVFGPAFQGTTGGKPERAERRRLLRQQDGGLFSGGIPDIERYAVASVGFKRVADGFVAVSPVGFEKRDVFFGDEAAEGFS